MAKKRKIEPKYSVKISLQAWDLVKAGAAVTLRIRDRRGLLGVVEIGQGTFGWKGAKSKSGFKRISWRKLAEDFHRNY
ncbi:hypothetical protein [Bradyrhizobium guangdongense]